MPPSDPNLHSPVLSAPVVERIVLYGGLAVLAAIPAIMLATGRVEPPPPTSMPIRVVGILAGIAWMWWFARTADRHHQQRASRRR